MRYVHPRANSVHKLFVRMADEDAMGEMPSSAKAKMPAVGAKMGAVGQPIPDDAYKSLNLGNLNRAEVVELADTPS